LRPVDFGKTSLVADWLRPYCDSPQDTPSLPVDVGWISLDEGDNDPARFLSYLIAALQSYLPQLVELPVASPPAAVTFPPDRLAWGLAWPYCGICWRSGWWKSFSFAPSCRAG
jgi:hypothetical protein